MGDTPRLQIKFSVPSDPRYLCVVRGAVGSLAAVIGWEDFECRAIVLAVDEALTNVIRHAYHSRTDCLIELECREIPDGLEITLLDNGEAPDRSKICAREAGCNQLLCLINPYSIPADKLMRSIKRFGEHVIPAFR